MKSPVETMLDAVEWRPVAPPSRIKDGVPYVTHEGILTICNFEIPCVMLSDGQRIMDGPSIGRFFQ